MPKKQQQQPISNDELCGLLMGMITEVQKAGWKFDCQVMDDGSLQMEFGKSNAHFKIIENNGSSYLTILEQDPIELPGSPKVTADL